MKNVVFIRRLGRLALHVQHRPHWSLALSVILVLLPWLTAFTPVADEPTAASEITINPAWQHYAGAEMRFSYPPLWTVEAEEREGETAYRLVSPDQMLQIRLTLTRLDGPANLRAIERHLIRTIEREAAFTRRFIRIAPAKHIAGHALATISYGATTTDDKETRGLRMGRAAHAGHILVIDVTTPTAGTLETSIYLIRQIVETIALDAPDQPTS